MAPVRSGGPLLQLNGKAEPRAEAVTKNETEHRVKGKRPATEIDDLCSEKKKSKLMPLEVGEPEVKNKKKKKKKKRKKKATGTAGSDGSRNGATGDVNVSKVDGTLKAEVDQMDKEETDSDNEEPNSEKSKLMPLEEKMDDGNEVGDPEVKSKKKKKRKKKKKANGTEKSDVDASKDGTFGAEADKLNQMDKEETDSDSEEPNSGSNTLELSSASNEPFENLRGTVSDVTLQAVENMGFKTMTEIQAKAIPPALEGKDLRGTAKTGSGKTLAFSIPLVELVCKEKFKPSKGTCALVISPTRELSMQILSVLSKLMEGRPHNLDLIIGGTNRAAQVESLEKGVSVVVATPGRLLDHMQNTPNFVFKNLKCLVIDEVDRICDVGFEEELKMILMLLPKSRQTLLFSATKDDRPEKLAELAVKAEPMEIDVDANKRHATVEGLEQVYAVCPSEKRFKILYTFLKKNQRKKIMVFFSTCRAVKFYYEVLTSFGLPVMYIHGHQSQNNRTSNFQKFSNAETGILLCTDVAARGWDIPDVDLIVQYDPPSDPNEYIHRVGRTARAGGRGKALLLLREEEIGFIKYLENHKVNIDRIEITCKDDKFQSKLEEIVKNDKILPVCAKLAMQSYFRSYSMHGLKKVFDYKTLDVKKIAKNFGFAKTPQFSVKRCFQKTKRTNGVNNPGKFKKLHKEKPQGKVGN